MPGPSFRERVREAAAAQHINQPGEGVGAALSNLWNNTRNPAWWNQVGGPALLKDMQTLPERAGSILMQPVNALDRFGRTLTGQEGGYGLEYDPSMGRVAPSQQLFDDANLLGGMAATGGMPIPKPTNSLGIVGGDLAKQLNTKVNLPSDPTFAEAVRGTPGASITEEGLRLNVVRYQKPDQSGSNAIRTGMFYLPEKSSNAKYYKKGGTPGNWYGGSEKIEGETLIQNPLFVKGATGGKAPEMAFDALKGKGMSDKLTSAARSAATAPLHMREEVVDDFLRQWGGDPDMAWEIIHNSGTGNQLTYALKEHVIAHAVRDAGHDAMVGYSKGKSGPFISEVFDTREIVNPSRGAKAGLGDIHPAYLGKLET